MLTFQIHSSRPQWPECNPHQLINNKNSRLATTNATTSTTFFQQQWKKKWKNHKQQEQLPSQLPKRTIAALTDCVPCCCRCYIRVGSGLQQPIRSFEEFHFTRQSIFRTRLAHWSSSAALAPSYSLIKVTGCWHVFGLRMQVMNIQLAGVSNYT